MPDVTAFVKEIAQFRRAVDSASQTNEIFVASKDFQSTTDLFYFDPNKATDEEWEKLGLNERQIRNIRNYQVKGGQFKRKEDLQKLYTISAKQYQQLEPYIRFVSNVSSVKQDISEIRPVFVAKEPERTTILPRTEAKPQIELNTADSSQLTQLPGIGAILASRTIKYRNRMGGFAHVAQLGEVYGINRDLLERLSHQLSADSSLIRKISVNTATYRDLISHPYLNEQQVRGILNYRRLQNSIKSIEELVQNNILKTDEAERIRPYLAF